MTLHRPSVSGWTTDAIVAALQRDIPHLSPTSPTDERVVKLVAIKQACSAH